ncbi:hypothetical protein NEMIN01_0755 [Nematocida minor]|uniref:uncharacterized protein n=1 Tax=Nematocida minor TaxID=1912983 RepID=UPI00221ED7D5|nr:uncharacterized protein NEMIN01_0755 [Nematocida minor]KAI5189892.1 hypothetical protein NEMIN01_0755 [Nematocida minor]
MNYSRTPAALSTKRAKNKKETIIEHIQLIKEKKESSEECAQLIKKLCPHVNANKYLKDTPRRCEESEKDSGNTSEKENSASSIKDRKCPVYLAVIEESILYADVLSRERLEEIVHAVREEVSMADLVHIHSTLSNALVSSRRYSYSAEYDRWLVLSAIKITEISKNEEHAMEYFPAIVERIKESTDGFRDRGIILSDYLTQSELLHQSSESAYFYNDIPSRPTVEEENDSLDEEMDISQITTLAEFYTIVKERTFSAEPEEKIKCTVLQLPSLILKEPVRNVKRYSLEIMEILVSIGTAEAADSVCCLLLVEDVAYDVFHAVYNRNKHSFRFRNILVACLTKISSTLRKDVSQRILSRYLGHEEHSEEDRKLGIDVLKKCLLQYHG